MAATVRDMKATNPVANPHHVSVAGNGPCIGKFGFVYRKAETTQGRQQTAEVVDRSSAQPHSSPTHIHLSRQAPITSHTWKAPLTDQKPAAQQKPATSLASRATVTSPIPITRQVPVAIAEESDGSVLSISSDSMSSQIDHPTKAHDPAMSPMRAPVASALGTETVKAPDDEDIEIHRFIKHLRKICSEGKPTADLDSSLKLLTQDLKESGVYRRFLEEEEEEEHTTPDSTSMLQELQEYVDRLRPTVELYRRELQEWDEVTEQKRLGVEDAKKTFESERDVDFSQLHCDDVETLKSYLTPEQTEILEQSLPIKPVMVEAKLDAINSKLDAELKRIQDHCHQVHSSLKMSCSNLDASTMEDTPKTLFTALKHS